MVLNSLNYLIQKYQPKDTCNEIVTESNLCVFCYRHGGETYYNIIFFQLQLKV